MCTCSDMIRPTCRLCVLVSGRVVSSARSAVAAQTSGTVVGYVVLMCF